MSTDQPREELPQVDLSDADDSTKPHAETGSEHTDVAAERDDYKDKWARAMAELENFRKRSRREQQEFQKYQAAPIVKGLLPGLDNLDRAIDAAKTTGKVEDLMAGVEMVRKQFADLLASFSVEPIASVGEPFDANLHEAIQQIPSERPAMEVVQDVERGYRLHDRVLRPSKVIVSSGPAPEQSADDA